MVYIKAVNSIKRTMFIYFWHSFVAALDASSSSFVVFGLFFSFLFKEGKY